MRILVLGGGVVGVTSAWYLARDGHEVTLVDRRPGPALQTSFANGGQISASYAEPWANPEAPLKILRWLARDDAPLLFRPRLDWRQWRFGVQFLLECLPGRTRRNTVQCLHAPRQPAARRGHRRAERLGQAASRYALRGADRAHVRALPDAGERASVRYWTGLRPATPSTLRSSGNAPRRPHAVHSPIASRDSPADSPLDSPAADRTWRPSRTPARRDPRASTESCRTFPRCFRR